MFDTSNDLARYLSPGERILWEGRGRRRLTSTSMGGLIFLTVFVAMALIFLMIFAVGGLSSRGRGDQIAVVVVPLIFLAVAFAVGVPLFIAGRQTANARYVVTSSAAMIVSQSSWTGRRVTVIPLKNAPQISLAENRDGTGTLIFGSNPYLGYGRYSSGWWTEAIPAFWNIERPLEVYQLIRKTMNNEQ